MEDVFARNKYNQEARDKMDASDFAGPHQSFPIKDQEDVDNAARLIGHADDPDAVKRNIIKIAKRKGLSLPESWQEEDGSEERMAGKTEAEAVEVIEQPESFSFYAPFVRVADKQSDKREVVGKATRGTPIDTYNTVITYDASKKAFARAKRIPLREMHQNKAVGKGLEWWGDDTAEDIFLHSYISRAADDTWTKVEEDILVGYSIKGANAKYGTIVRDGKSIAAIVDYDLVEVSLVDNPSCPGCDIAIMRGDGIEQVIASDEEMAEIAQKEQPQEEVTQAQPETIERAGASLSAANREKLHTSRDAMLSMCADAGCPECQAMLNMDSDNDGDTDAMERVERMIGQSMNTVYARMQAYLGEFSRRQSDVQTLQSAIERIAGSLEQTANKADVDAKMDKVLAELAEVKGLFERVAKTPLPGGPHTGRSASKHLATDGPASPSGEEAPDLLRQISQSGVQLTAQQQALIVAGSLKRM